MASLYKNNGIWYIAVSYNGTKKSRNIKTKGIKVAESIILYDQKLLYSINRIL